MKVRIELPPQDVEGLECPCPLIKLRVKDRYGAAVSVMFRVDTQADVTTIPIALAKREGIPFGEEKPGKVRGLTGAVKRFRGRLRVVVGQNEHEWPCDFIQAAVDPDSGATLPELDPVLGRAGFLNDYAVSIDSGFLIVTRVGPVRRWMRRRLQGFWKLFGMVHPSDQPL